MYCSKICQFKHEYSHKGKCQFELAKETRLICNEDSLPQNPKEIPSFSFKRDESLSGVLAVFLAFLPELKDIVFSKKWNEIHQSN